MILLLSELRSENNCQYPHLGDCFRARVSYLKGSGMLVVSRRGVKHLFWSDLR